MSETNPFALTNLFKDPFILSSVEQGRWNSSSFTIANCTICAGQDENTNIMMPTASEVTPGLYFVSGNIVSVSTGGLRPVLGDSLNEPITCEGAFERLIRVTSATNQFVGFKDYGGTDAQLAGPLICVRICD